jgi:hypothetical protein
MCRSNSFKLNFAACMAIDQRNNTKHIRPMPILSWHDSILLGSSLTSLVGIGYTYWTASKDPTESEAMQETMIRMTFVYWTVFCLSSLGDRFCTLLPYDLSCRFKILSLLCFMLTFCCVLSVPMHLIEQRQRQRQPE